MLDGFIASETGGAYPESGPSLSELASAGPSSCSGLTLVSAGANRPRRERLVGRRFRVSSGPSNGPRSSWFSVRTSSSRTSCWASMSVSVALGPWWLGVGW